MKLLPVVFVLVLALASTFAQYRVNPVAEKPGACPPLSPVQICTRSCLYDSHCEGIGKCCPTSCGGFVCSQPVSKKQPSPSEKPGMCPKVPKGRWVCSSRCSVDSDCTGSLKCCKNRCGALACQKPDEEERQPDPYMPYSDYDLYGNPIRYFYGN